MFSSILCGLEALTSRGELEGLAVHPEDIPEAYRSLPVDLLSLEEPPDMMRQSESFSVFLERP